MRYLEQFFYGNMDPQARESIHPEAMRKVQRTLSDLENGCWSSWRDLKESIS